MKHTGVAEWVVVFAVLLAVREGAAIKCYRCSVKPPNRGSNETQRLCTSFTPSPHYEVDCPHSTLCMKHIYKLKLPLRNGSVEGILRDCAPQRYDYREYLNKTWQKKTMVDTEAYNEGCISSNVGQDVKSTSTEYCYCSRHLCNSASKPAGRDATSAAHTDAMAVIFVFNAMKYIRSLRV